MAEWPLLRLGAMKQKLSSDAYKQKIGVARRLQELAGNSSALLAALITRLEIEATTGGPAKRPAGAPLDGPESKKQRMVADREQRRKAIWDECLKMVEKLLKNGHSTAFRQPVDIKALKIPDYYNHIKQPMDLGTVKRNLLGRVYREPGQMADDVRLVWDNCYRYNGDKHAVSLAAKKMSEMFERDWAKADVEQRWAVEVAREKREEQVRAAAAPAARMGCDAARAARLQRRGTRICVQRRCAWWFGASGGVLWLPGRSSGACTAGGACARRLHGARCGLAYSPPLPPALRSLPPQLMAGDAAQLPDDSLPLQMAELRNQLGEHIAATDHAAGVAPGAVFACEPHRDMSFEEKRKLSAYLSALPGEKGVAILDIIRESMEVCGAGSRQQQRTQQSMQQPMRQRRRQLGQGPSLLSLEPTNTPPPLRLPLSAPLLHPTDPRGRGGGGSGHGCTQQRHPLAAARICGGVHAGARHTMGPWSLHPLPPPPLPLRVLVCEWCACCSMHKPAGRMRWAGVQGTLCWAGPPLSLPCTHVLPCSSLAHWC